MDILIDIGHTADKAREHPSAFDKATWTSGKGARVASLLGFDASTKDSVEHMLNKAFAKALKVQVDKLGLSSEVVDWPWMGNDAEIGKVVEYCKEKRPRLLVSVHANAAGGAGWTSLQCKASGSVVLHYESSSTGKRLASSVASAMRACRKAHGGPDNRASLTMPSRVAVLRKTPCPAVLLETCFYDNGDDLLWTASHLDVLAASVAAELKTFLTSK